MKYTAKQLVTMNNSTLEELKQMITKEIEEMETDTSPSFLHFLLQHIEAQLNINSRK